MGGNLVIKSFKRFLAEGGNVKVGDVQADHIDLTKVVRKVIVKDIVDSLLILNKQFEKKYNLPLWSKEEYVKSGKVMSGSSEHFVNLEIPDEEFSKLKPTVGDIDLQVDKNLEKQVDELLKKGYKFGKLTYLGRSETAVDQISGLFAVAGHDINIQIDFEFVNFTKLGMPTDWASFSHSSSWADIQQGVKGVFHKFLLGSIDFAAKFDAVILKGKRMKPTKMSVHPFAFSVGAGLRAKFRHATDEEKATAGVKGEAFVPLETKDSKYVNDLEEIFYMLFRKKPSKADMQKMNSFVGMVELFSKFPKSEQDHVFEEYITRIWGKGAQGLYRGNPKMDLEHKSASVNYLYEQIPYLKKHQKATEDIMATYYANYK